jgi:hypothetical protein
LTTLPFAHWTSTVPPLLSNAFRRRKNYRHRNAPVLLPQNTSPPQHQRHRHARLGTLRKTQEKRMVGFAALVGAKEIGVTPQ